MSPLINYRNSNFLKTHQTSVTTRKWNTKPHHRRPSLLQPSRPRLNPLTRTNRSQSRHITQHREQGHPAASRTAPAAAPTPYYKTASEPGSNAKRPPAGHYHTTWRWWWQSAPARDHRHRTHNPWVIASDYRMGTPS